MASFGDKFSATSLEQTAEDEAWERSDPLFDRPEHGAEPDEARDADRDALYSILNLERTASDDEIQKSYRRLAGASPPLVRPAICSLQRH